MSEPATIDLVEYEPRHLAPDSISEEQASRIWREFGVKVHVEPPSFKTDNAWRLTSHGWVGWIVVDSRLTLHLLSHVPIGNLFGMLDCAYRLRSFEILPGTTACDSMQELFEVLARVLAGRVIDRARKGLYKTYVGQHDDLPYVRGRLDTRSVLLRPGRVRLPCRYDENTVDIEENQILASTLHVILLTGVCSERTHPLIAKAFRTLRGAVSLRRFRPDQCLIRLYNRLCVDYRPLHALCRFFLESTGPSHHSGPNRMVPFVLDMPHLYELFVAE